MTLQVGVKAFIVNEKGQVLLLLKPAKGGHHDQIWDIPGGRIETSMSLIENLGREVFEETGMELDTTSPVLVSAQEIRVRDELYVVRLSYVAKASGEVSISEEHLEYKWCFLEEMEEMNLDPYIREVLSKVIDTIKAL